MKFERWCRWEVLGPSSQFRNLSLTAAAALSRDAYAMSHLSAEACKQRLAAGRGDEYPIAAAAAIARYITSEHWTDLLCVVRV